MALLNEPHALGALYQASLWVIPSAILSGPAMLTSELDGDLDIRKTLPARSAVMEQVSPYSCEINHWWTISIPFASSDAQSNQERHFEVFIGQAIRNSVSSIKTNHLTDHIATVAGTREMMALRFECSANGIFNVIEAKTSSKNRNFRKKVICNFFSFMTS